MSHTSCTVFIGTGFQPSRRERAQILADLLTQAGFNCVFGEGFGGTQISDGVRKLLAAADVVVVLLEPSSGSKREPSQWLLQEAIYATALKKPSLLLVAKGVRFSQGLFGDVELINFAVSNYATVLPQVVRQLNVILLKKRLRIGITSDKPHFYLTKEPSENECNEMARAQIKSAGRLTQRKRYDEALKSAAKAVRLDRHCWQARIRYGGLLMVAGRLNEATRIHAQILKDFKDNKIACAAAKHNMAVAKELQFGIDSRRANREAESLFEDALNLDPTRPYTRAALICTYLRLGKLEEANKLLERSLRYEDFIPVMRRELDQIVDGIKLLGLLPAWAQNLLYPLQSRRDFDWLN